MKLIVDEITGGSIEARSLLRPNDSPHTYTPTPADAVAAQHALTLVYVSPELDGWIAQIGSPHRIAAMGLLPESLRLKMPEDVLMEEDGHGHGHIDPHFWPDPAAVMEVAMPLALELGRLLPEKATAFADNAQALEGKLRALDAEIKAQFAGIAHRKVAVFHPSWLYFLRRYGLEVTAIIEPSPGKELSPRSMEAIINRLKETQTRILLTEPQLARGPVQAVADAAGVPVVEIDPLGGSIGATMYEDLMRKNAAVLQKALS